MSIKIMSDVWDSDYAKQSHARLLVMLKLADHASDDGECYPSQNTIATKCGLARPTVNRIIRELEADGKLVVAKVNKTDGKHNRYTLQFRNYVTDDDTLCHPTLQGMSPTMTGYVTDDDTNHQLTINEPSENHRIKEIFEFWKTTMSLNGNTILTNERKARIKDRLKQGYTIERIKNAIVGCSVSPHHCGQNDTRTVYNDIELICRTGAKVEFFERIALNSQPQSLPQSELDARAAVRAGMEALNGR